MTAFVRIGDVKNKFHSTDWNQVLLKHDSNGDPLASSVFFFNVPSIVLMYERELQIPLIRRFFCTYSV